MKMTPRELRAELLFNIDDQNMTVAELRRILFTIDQQDLHLTLVELAQLVNELRSQGVR